MLVEVILHARFIPVCTGNTSRSLTSSSKRTVHPRGYGEHWVLWALLLYYLGSSPWVRGTRAASSALPACARFIPVGTGNTYGNIAGSYSRSVHPRGYGEHSKYRQLIYKRNNPSEKVTKFLMSK